MNVMAERAAKKRPPLADQISEAVTRMEAEGHNPETCACGRCAEIRVAIETLLKERS